MKKTSKSNVIIKLCEDDIPYLNATLYLGVMLEDWCTAAIACGVGQNHGSFQWRKIVSSIRMNIYDQTTVEYHEFGEAKTQNIVALRKILDTNINKFEKELKSQKLRR